MTITAEDIFSSVPVSTRVQELEKREHEGAKDDMACLKDMLQRLIDMQSVQQNAQNEKGANADANTSEELQATISELQEVRQTLLSFERRYTALQRKSERLESELRAVVRQLELARNAGPRRACSRKAWKLNQLKDFIAAVKVAERRREEAQAEVTRLMDFNRIVGSRDEALWDELMYKYQRTTKRNALLAWADAHLTAYPSISVSNFTSDWCDGRAFCALIHHFQPDIVDRAALLQREQCPELAIRLASKLKVHIDPKLFAGTKPDFKHVMEVVFELYKKLDLGEKNC
ncbi:unnamed protein product [Nippostrongylus brasiliensis]|uniref:Calponin-homology (CH) domain-containing protein n=1 Tax=Nippostrongylus brasiliensis TaxID=27835 RepID=A0A0N4YQZ5_NIPBR|nr:unnamed protein product [Nippostrongylus brasiliensis]